MVVTNPDVRGRQEILDLYLQDKPLGDDVDVRMLARGTPGFSGAGFILTLLATTVFIKAALGSSFFLVYAIVQSGIQRVESCRKILYRCSH